MGKKSKAPEKPAVDVSAPPSPSKGGAAVTRDAASKDTRPADSPNKANNATPPLPLAPPPPPLTLTQRLLPEGGLLPWWVVLLFSVYLLLQMGLTLEHPCSVLGVWTGMTKTQLNKQYRSLSMCTHPDKLTGHAEDDILRGQMLFKRASTARDQLNLQMREDTAAAESAAAAAAKAAGLPAGSRVDEDAIAAAASCSTQLDTAIFQGLSYMLGSAVETGALSMVTSIFSFLWEVITLQYDISMTISIVLLLMTLVRTLQSFLGYLVSAGPLSTLISVFTTVVVGPLPTLYRLFVLPVVRFATFARTELIPLLRGAPEDEGTADSEPPIPFDSDAPDEAVGQAILMKAPQETPAPIFIDPPVAAANGGHGNGNGDGAATAGARPPRAPNSGGREDHAPPRKGVRQRRAPPTKGDVDEQREALLRGEAQIVGPDGRPIGEPLSSLSLQQVVARKPLPHARPAAAAAMQFDLVFSTTKYVIPLVALVATGQVFNGLWSSMITAQLLHKLPAMRPELHHVLIIVAGALHTLLCAGKSQLTELENKGDGLLQLQWQWSVRDVLAVANVMALGATFAATAGGGNEPAFCASFAAGIALRMFVYEALPASASSALAELLRDKAQIELVGVDEVAVRAGRGVGTCSGGPVRFLLGSMDAPKGLLAPATLLVKVSLLCLPALAAAQWAVRCAHLYQRLRREGERTGHRERRLKSGELLVPVLRRRLLLSSLVCACTLTLVGYFALFELNAVGSSLGNFLIIALTGCHFESLLSTYDVRGRLRSAVFFVMFMVL